MKFQVRQVLLMFFLSAVTILYSLPLLGVPMNLMDEGWTLLASQMILRGSIIYRDLFIHYTPGTFYVLAFVFQLLGQTVYASRILMLVFNISSILILYGIARRLCSIPYSILACLLHVTYVFPIQISPTWLALTWSFAAIFLFTKYVKIRRWHILFSSGFLTGLTTMFKQNIGAYVFSTILTFLIIELIVSILNRKPFTSGALRRLISVYVRNFLIIVIGICISVFPVVLYFYFNHSVSQFMYDNIFWLSKQLGASLFPPLPSRAMGITGMLFYLSIVILSIAVLRLLFKYIRSREINDFFLLYALFCLFMLLHVYPRYDLPHLVPALGPSFVLGSYHLQCLSGFGKREGRPLRILVRSGSLALIAIIVCFAIAPAALGSIGRTGVFYQEQSLRNVTSSEDRVVYDVVDYIKSHAGVDERILVVPNSPMIYFLTGRAPPTEHALLHPWILTPEIESDISKAVESGKVKYVIFVGDSATTKHGIAEYYWYSRLFQSIISHYQIEKTFSNFYILSKSATDHSGLMMGMRSGIGTPTYGEYSTDRGIAEIQISKLEDDSSAICLLLHPSAAGQTWWNFSIKAGEDYRVLDLYYGFEYGANKTNGVRFSAYLNDKGVLTTSKSYDKRLQSISTDISSLNNLDVNISLSTDPLGNSDYDWSVWIIKVSK